VSEASVGRRPFMPRKALVPARAALRFAHQAAGECGAAQPVRRGSRAPAPAGVPVTVAARRPRWLGITQGHCVDFGIACHARIRHSALTVCAAGN